MKLAAEDYTVSPDPLLFPFPTITGVGSAFSPPAPPPAGAFNLGVVKREGRVRCPALASSDGA